MVVLTASRWDCLRECSGASAATSSASSTSTKLLHLSHSPYNHQWPDCLGERDLPRRSAKQDWSSAHLKTTKSCSLKRLACEPRSTAGSPAASLRAKTCSTCSSCSSWRRGARSDQFDSSSFASSTSRLARNALSFSLFRPLAQHSLLQLIRFYHLFSPPPLTMMNWRRRKLSSRGVFSSSPLLLHQVCTFAFWCIWSVSMLQWTSQPSTSENFRRRSQSTSRTKRKQKRNTNSLAELQPPSILPASLCLCMTCFHLTSENPYCSAVSWANYSIENKYLFTGNWPKCDVTETVVRGKGRGKCKCPLPATLYSILSSSSTTCGMSISFPRDKLASRSIDGRRCVSLPQHSDNGAHKKRSSTCLLKSAARPWKWKWIEKSKWLRLQHDWDRYCMHKSHLYANGAPTRSQWVSAVQWEERIIWRQLHWRLNHWGSVGKLIKSQAV